MIIEGFEEDGLRCEQARSSKWHAQSARFCFASVQLRAKSCLRRGNSRAFNGPESPCLCHNGNRPLCRHSRPPARISTPTSIWVRGMPWHEGSSVEEDPQVWRQNAWFLARLGNLSCASNECSVSSTTVSMSGTPAALERLHLVARSCTAFSFSLSFAPLRSERRMLPCWNAKDCGQVVCALRSALLSRVITAAPVRRSAA